MKIKLEFCYSGLRGSSDTVEVKDFVENYLTKSGGGEDSIPRIETLLNRQAKVLALIVDKMAEERKVTAQEVAGLSDDYYTRVEFAD